MGQRTNYVSWGEGVAYDLVNGIFFPAVEQVQFNFGLEAISIVDADSLMDDAVTIRAPLTGHIVFGKLNSELFAILTGGAASAGGYERVRHEKKSVTAGKTLTLGATPYTYSELVSKLGTGYYKRVASGPTGREYSIAGKVLTFPTSAGTSQMDISYLKWIATVPVIINLDDNDAPTSFGLVSTFRAVDKDASTEILKDIIIVCPKVKRTSAFSWGTGARTQNKVEFDFTIEKSSGGTVLKAIFPTT